MKNPYQFTVDSINRKLAWLDGKELELVNELLRQLLLSERTKNNE